MTDFKFYIFGTPDGFDFYQGTYEEKTYFQMFYDGSTEDEKLSIRRRDNGQVVYSWLCYNLTSGANRTGAFFGISAVSDKYCTDNNETGLYGLFKHIYNTVLKRSVLLRKINNQTVFGVRSFKDAEGEIKFITDLLLQNLKKYFDGKFLSQDNSFKQGVNLDVEKQLNHEAEDKTIAEDLREFPRLALSPSFKGGIIKTVRVEKVLQLCSDISEIENGIKEFVKEGGPLSTLTKRFNLFPNLSEKKQQELIDGYKEAEIKHKNWLNNCNTAKQTVLEFRRDEPNNFQKEEQDIDNIITGLAGLETVLSDFKDIINSPKGGSEDNFKLTLSINPRSAGQVSEGGDYKKGASISVSLIASSNYRFVNWTEDGVKTTFPEEFQYTMPAHDVFLVANLKKKGKLDLKKILLSLLLIVLIAGGIYYYLNNNPPPPPPVVTTEDYKQQADKALQEGKYQEAKDLYTRAGITDFSSIIYGMDGLNVKADKKLNEGKFDEAIKYVEGAKIFGWQEADNYIKEINKKKSAPSEQRNEDVADNRGTSSNTQRVSSQSTSTAPIVIRIYYAKATSWEQGATTETGQTFKVGDRLLVQAEQNKNLVKGSNWTLIGNNNGIIEVNGYKRNPIRVECKKSGKVTLQYGTTSYDLKIRE